MSKAHDGGMVLVLKLVEKMGFNENWRKWIHDCITSVSYRVLNESPSKVINPLRGLRQGDPTSAFLFLICTEVFWCNEQAGRKSGHFWYLD